MERKVGEIFEYEGKVYQVVRPDSCTNCAFKNMSCAFRRSALGHCAPGNRTDKVSVIFKEVKNMDVIGVIAEYNPFHNGHMYHLKKIKDFVKTTSFWTKSFFFKSFFFAVVFLMKTPHTLQP